MSDFPVPDPAKGEEFSLLQSIVVEGFVPVALATTYDGGTSIKSASAEMENPLLNPQAQPAVIPLPRPIYAAIVLLVLAVGARRLIVRTCHA